MIQTICSYELDDDQGLVLSYIVAFHVAGR